MSAFDIFEMNPSSKWPLVTQAIPIWKKLESIIFSKDVEVLYRGLFTRLAFTLLSDEAFVRDGLTMFLARVVEAVQLDARGEVSRLESANRHDRGRDVEKNAAAPCQKKFLFASNTGYAFVVSDHSYHSVETVVGKNRGLWGAKGLRRTIIANWYDQPVSKQSFVKQQVVVDR
eukprot:1190915-Prorocentrum_minimum.AAC.1